MNPITRGSRGKYHMGLVDREGIWMWQDGTLLNYDTWAPNQPNGIDERSALLRVWDMAFNDIKLTNEATFICEKSH